MTWDQPLRERPALHPLSARAGLVRECAGRDLDDPVCSDLCMTWGLAGAETRAAPDLRFRRSGAVSVVLVAGEGFEPPKLSQLIYSQPPLGRLGP